MARLPDRSAYILELSVSPGGSRWAQVHVYSKLEHIRAWLEQFCKNEAMDAYHAIWYGATLAICVVQKGQVVKCIDLNSYIKASLGEHGPIPVEDRDACLQMVRKARQADIDEDDPDDADDEWFDDDIEMLEEVKLEVSWLEISSQLPALEPPLIKPGQKIRIKRMNEQKVMHYVKSGEFSYGSYEHEVGEELPPPFEVEEPDEMDDE